MIDTAHAMTAEGLIDEDSRWEDDWRPIDNVKRNDRTWRFFSLDAEREQDKRKE